MIVVGKSTFQVYSRMASHLDCPTCEQRFDRGDRLASHISKSTPVACDECCRSFCSENKLHQHKRTSHAIATGAGVVHEHEIDLKRFDPNGGYEG